MCVAAASDGPEQVIDVTSCKSAGVRVLTSMGRPTTAASIRDQDKNLHPLLDDARHPCLNACGREPDLTPAPRASILATALSAAMPLPLPRTPLAGRSYGATVMLTRDHKAECENCDRHQYRQSEAVYRTQRDPNAVITVQQRAP